MADEKETSDTAKATSDEQENRLLERTFAIAFEQGYQACAKNFFYAVLVFLLITTLIRGNRASN